MYKIGEEELIICPYNNHHVVAKLRIQKHIINCQKNNPHVKLATCFYNYSHRIKPEDLLAHYEICPNKTRIDGTRYDEFVSHPPSASSIKDFLQRDITNINTKTHFFHDLPFFISNPNEECEDDSQKLGTSGSESEDEDFQLKSSEKVALEINLFSSDGNDNKDNKEEEKHLNDEIVGKNDDYEVENDELKPLPLPKTVSKAFVYLKQGTSKPLPVKPTQSKPFPKGRGFLAFSPPKEQRTTDHLLPDLSDMDTDQPKRKKSSTFFSKFCSSNASVSSVFDDTTTLNSEEIIFSDEFDINYNGEFILTNFDKYTKI